MSNGSTGSSGRFWTGILGVVGGYLLGKSIAEEKAAESPDVWRLTGESRKRYNELIVSAEDYMARYEDDGNPAHLHRAEDTAAEALGVARDGHDPGAATAAEELVDEASDEILRLEEGSEEG